MDHWVSRVHLGEEIEAGQRGPQILDKKLLEAASTQGYGKKKQLEKVQGDIETNEVQQRQIMLEEKAHKEYIQALNEEDITWILKSRSLWLQAGDQNTSFFHRQTKTRQWINQIS
jgi:hypothetical protein